MAAVVTARQRWQLGWIYEHPGLSLQLSLALTGQPARQTGRTGEGRADLARAGQL